MNNIAIKVDNLTKIYHLYDKPQDRLKEALNPFKKSYHHDFYAMHDVSFEIKKGETVGIIGKNGAGKSTLLKMITGVLTPTSGSIEVNGKIASLLELGAGFNPEMTGLENIYLNGTLMGFTKEEMDSKVDTILEFADIGKFIYQPVKMYSSGMFARLAFSAAVSIKPEILIVDEVLSVGDMEFQAKSMAKMKNMIENDDATVLFVSHDINAIKSLCENAIYIDNGTIVKIGKSSETADLFVNDQKQLERKNVKSEMKSVIIEQEKDLNIQQKINYFCKKIKNNSTRYGTHDAEIQYVTILNKNKEIVEAIYFNEIITIEIGFKCAANIKDLLVAFHIKDKNFLEVIGTNSIYENITIKTLNNRQTAVISFSFKNRLKSGNYFLKIMLADKLGDTHYFDFIDNAIGFKAYDNLDEKRWALVAPEILEAKIDYL